MSAAPVTALATVDQPRRSLLAEMAGRYGMEPRAFADTLRATVIPREATNEEFAAFLVVAREYDLNPLTKEIYAFPKKGGGIQPIVPIDGWTNIINSNKALDGIEFDDHIEDGKVTSITARIWRKDRAKPIAVTEYLIECDRGTEPWKKWPRRMLRHKALIQCARYAFGLAGIVDPDEAERMGAPPARDVTPLLPSPPTPPSPPPAPPKPGHDAETGEVWEDAQEIIPPSPPVRTATTVKPAPTDADLEIPAALDRRVKKGPDVIDADAWLNDLSGALSGCEDIASIWDVQKDVMLPMKGKVPGGAWTKATKMITDEIARIQSTILNAG